MEERSRARRIPTVLALLAFVPLGLLLWWAVVGLRPAPALLDWEAFGFNVSEGGTVALAEVALDESPDPVLSTLQMAGRQGPLLGPLDPGRMHGDGAFAAVVRDTAGASSLTEALGVAGLVVTLPGDGGFERCGFDAAVPVRLFDEAAGRLGPDVSASREDMTGRCQEGEVALAVPLVRRVVVPLGLAARLSGQRAESALLPAGVALVDGQGRIEVVDTYDAGAEAGLPLYPRDVARQALGRAVPANPNTQLGSLGDPVYPVLAREGEALWWVVPISPEGDGSAVSGLARTRADQVEAGRLNEIVVVWLDDPLPGPVLIERRALAVLQDGAEVPSDALDQFRVLLNVPDAEGRWLGHIAFGGQVRYRLTVDGSGEVCLDDVDGHHVGCRGEG